MYVKTIRRAETVILAICMLFFCSACGNCPGNTATGTTEGITEIREKPARDETPELPGKEEIISAFPDRKITGGQIPDASDGKEQGGEESFVSVPIETGQEEAAAPASDPVDADEEQPKEEEHAPQEDTPGVETCENDEQIQQDDLPEEPEPKKHEHSYTAEVTVPTCDEDGYTVFTCECGACFTEAGDHALGHDWVDDYEEVTQDIVVQECHTFCGSCGADLTALGMTVDEILDHTEQHAIRGEGSRRYEEWVNVVIGTETVTIYVGTHCSRCGKTK